MMFYNIDNEKVYTLEEIKNDYLEMIEDGTLDKDIYNDFEYYLSACMASNGGSLVRMY